MKTHAIGVVVVLGLLSAVGARGAEVTQSGRWRFHSSFWMNLHQALMHDAAERDARDLTDLSASERTAWEGAVAGYRKAVAGGGNISFARPMLIAQDQLAQAADDATAVTVEGPLGEQIRAAAPVYRSHWWERDDAANRFFIAYAAAMLRETGEGLVRAHEAVYREQFPKTVRVDVAAYGGPFGAYSVSLIDSGFVVTMSCRDAAYQGFAPVEMVLHETSHAVVSPHDGTVGKAIDAAAKRLGVEAPRDLWHAIIFATSGELARRALAARGVTSYTPSSQDLFTRAWPQYRLAVESHWLPYLAGRGTLEDAIDKVVAAVKAGR